MNVVLDIIIVLVIVSIGGFFASAEMALVSLREGQVRSLARRGRRGATAARLASDPNRFLASVQIGTTLATLVTGAYGADTLAGVLKRWLISQHVGADWAGPLAYVVVTACVTFVSLVLSELAPKRLALQRTVAIALFAAPTLDVISRLARPVVWLLSVSVNGVVRLLGADPDQGRQAMTEQEVRELVTGTQTISADERRIVGEVFDAGKRRIREVLRPRTEVEFLPAGITVGQAARIASSVPYSRLPVYRDSYDNVVGFVHIRDLLGTSAPPLTELIDGVVRPVKFLPISKTVLSALSEMRRERVHLAIVADEYGGTAGIVTLEDLVEELIGDITDEYDTGEAPARKLPQGEVEVDGLLNLDEFAEQTGIRLPEGPYETVAGFVLAALGELPAAGDTVSVTGYTITVTELDGRRIARLRVTPVPASAGPGTGTDADSGPPAGPRPEPGPSPSADLGQDRATDSYTGPLHGNSLVERVDVSAPGGFDTVLVVDFGAQYAQLIARRVRECHVYSEIVPPTMPLSEMLARQPKAIILSGGPASVYAEGAPAAPAGLLTAGVPVFGICYGHQVLVRELGGTVERTGAAEYGGTPLRVLDETGSTLLAGLGAELSVWMSHGDTSTAAPPGFTVTAQTAATPAAAVEDAARKLYGVQFHPEVMHTDSGTKILRRFLEAAGCRPNWTMLNVVEEQTERIREQVGAGRAICGLSGGVDSAVAAALVQRALGDRLTCVFVDHGLLRKGEAEQVEQDFVAATGVNLHVVDAAEEFLGALAGVTDPEDKRKIIGREFIRAFERAARDITASAGAHGETTGFLVQGTLYPDVVESGGGSGTANIKSHHNVGGLPDDLKFELVEPLRWLFKDEVRKVGEELGLPGEIVWRQPFPGPGLAIRIIGEVTAERLAILRDADAIARAELTAAGLDQTVWQCPVVLLADVRSVGVQGDGRTYGHPVVLRPVTSEDAMTADWARLPYDLLARISTRITNEVREVNRVALDVTSKPPGTIEWE